MSDLFASIDLGVNGWVATLDYEGRLHDLQPLPVAGGAIIGWTLAQEIRGRHDVVCEKVHAMPNVGSKSSFSMGHQLGSVVTTASILQIPMHQISPTVWKRAVAITRRGKEGKSQAREIAAQRYPDWAGMFSRVKDHDAAEAVLIGLGWLLTR